MSKNFQQKDNLSQYPGEHCLTHQGKRQIFKKCSRVRPKRKFSTGEIRKSTSEITKPTGDDVKIQRGELTNILRWLKNIYTWFIQKHNNRWEAFKSKKSYEKLQKLSDHPWRLGIEPNIRTIRWIMQLKTKFTPKGHNTSLSTDYLISCTKLKSHCRQDLHTHYHTS